MNDNFNQMADNLITKVCDAIPFAPDDDFNCVIDDCICALERKPLPSYYSTAGFDFPEFPNGGCYLAMALHYLMEMVEERKFTIPDDLRDEVDKFFSSNGIRFGWDKERFIMQSFYVLEEDRVSDLVEYKGELEKRIANAESNTFDDDLSKLMHVKKTIAELSGIKPVEEKQTPMEKLKMLIVLNNGKDFSRSQLAAFDNIDPDDEEDGSDMPVYSSSEPRGIRKMIGRDCWTDQYDDNPDEYNA